MPKENESIEKTDAVAENANVADNANVAENANVADNANVAEDADDLKDADNKEVIAYALGGISESISNFDMNLKNNLFMYVLLLNPIAIAFIGILGTLWDAISDPIMANITDNSKNRWGRRRPFILIGGLGTTILSVLIWWNFPKSDKIVKNVPDIPEVTQSQDALVKFGKMIKGYGISKTQLKLILDSKIEKDTKKPANNIEDILKKSLKKLNGGISIANEDFKGKTLPLKISTKGFEKKLVNENPIGQELFVNMSLNKITVDNSVRIEKEYFEERSLLTLFEDLIKGRNDYVGLSYDGEKIDFKHNTFKKSSVYRARVSVIEKTLIETLGQYYNIPYWKCFPKNDDKGSLLRPSLELSDISLIQNFGLKAENSDVYESMIDFLINSVEKIRIQKVVKYKLTNKIFDKEIELILQSSELEIAELDIIKDEFKSGKISQGTASIINKIIRNNKNIADIRKELLTKFDNNPYKLYTSLHTKFLLYGLGENMDLSKYEYTDSEQKIINKIIEKAKIGNLNELYMHLWNKHDKPFDEQKSKLVAGSWQSPRFLKSEIILNRLQRSSIKGEKIGFIQKIKNGINIFGENPQDDKIVIYMMIAMVIFATFRTINGVAYYALGIELSPSYDGRTKVIAIRSVMQKLIGLGVPWLFPLVLLPCFTDAIEGAFWLGITCGVISVPLLIYSVMNTKERVVIDKNKKSIPLFKSIMSTLKVSEFWRVLFLFMILSKSLGMFRMAGGYLILYWIFDGSLLYGASYLAGVGSMGVFLALLSVPLVKWICDRFQKHNAMRFSIIVLMLGSVSSWWCYDPERPYLLFVMPFFTSIGISSMYTVMGALMADVTDADELKNHSRREAMFGAVNAMIMKASGPLGTIMASIIVVISGFDIDVGAHQAEGVFTNMRILVSFFPLAILAIALLLLNNYPLTKERMIEIKAILKERRIAAKAAGSEE